MTLLPPVDAGSATEAALVEAVRAARSAGRRLRVRGGGTTAVAPGPDADWIEVGAHRGIVALRPADSVLTVRAGTPLAEVDAALGEVGFRVPIRAWDPGRGTIGGAVAAGAEGLVARNGLRWRDHVLGARAILGTGEVVDVGASVVKSVAGFDAARTLAGSHGCLAVITCLHLRLEPIPESAATVVVGLSSPGDVAAVVASLDAVDLAPSGVVVGPADEGRDVVVYARLEGPADAVQRTVRRLVGEGWRASASDAWEALAASVCTPVRAGFVRRVARCSRRDPTARIGAQRAGAWIADLGRSRLTWTESAPAVPPDESMAGPSRDPGTAALIGRLRAAFDPDGTFAAGRGWGGA